MFKRQRQDSGSDDSCSKVENAPPGTHDKSPEIPDSWTMLPDVGMTTGAQALYKDQLLFDFTLEVEDKQFKVHKVIMATISDYFKVMLTGGMRESQTDRVKLEGLTALAVSNMIQFVYTGEFGSPKARPEELLSCAVYLQIPAAIAVCTDTLCDRMDYQNCFDTFSLFKRYSLKNGHREATEFIGKHRDGILKGAKLEDMPHDKFLIIMECWRKSEWHLFLSVKQWVDVDSQNRKQHLNDLMSCVRFALMTPKELESIKEMAVHSEADGAWRELINEALTYHALPAHQKVVNEQNRVRGEPRLVVFSSGEYNPCVLYTLQKSKFTYDKRELWQEQKDIKEAYFERGIDAAIAVNNFLMVSDVKDTQKWHIFDPRTKEWARMGNMVDPRSDATLVYTEKFLYALGGSLLQTKKGRERTDCMEKYDFETDTWSVVPSTLPATAEKLGAGVINGNIYVVPHKDVHDNDDEMDVRLDCYDPGSNTWSGKATLVEPKYSQCGELQVLELWQEEVLCIMRQGFNLHYYTPSTNQWSVFNPLPYVDTDLMYTPNLHCRVLTHGNTLFLFNFPYQKQTWMEYEKKSGCAKWTMRHRGQRIIEDRLNDFLVTEDEYYKNEVQYFPAVLAMV